MELASMSPSASFTLQYHHHIQHRVPISLSSCPPSVLIFPSRNRALSFGRRLSCSALKTGVPSDGSRVGSRSGSTEGHGDGLDLHRKPVVSPALGEARDPDEGVEEEDRDVGGEEGGSGRWVDWEDQIMEEAVPLVGLVRMILHSGKYSIGARLIPEHQKIVLEKLLPYHPEYEKKIGCGIDYITVGYHPQFQGSRCLFIVRTDGELVDFSYWKCIKGLIRTKYPLLADSFFLRHFDRRKRNDHETGT